MTLKIDRINAAYSQLRISGLTVNPDADDVDIALDRFETMMSELSNRGICLDYNFELNPDPNSPTNVIRAYWQMMETNLAVRLIPDFNKAVPPKLEQQATQSLSNASARVASENARQVQYPRRMPRGSANTLRTNRWQRYQRPQLLPPNECATNNITINDIDDYIERFRAYLGEETIASFTIKADPGLTIQSSSNSDTEIDYRVLATDNSTDGVWQQVRIIVTTSSGRVETRLINFNILPDETIGSVGV
jgi:hypothetical protein